MAKSGGWPKDGGVPKELKAQVDFGTDAEGNPGKIVFPSGLLLLVR